jgi:hypothetical protein
VTLAGGLHTSPALVTHEGCQSGIQVALSPLGARALLGLPASELVSLDVEATEVCGALANEIQQRVQAAATWPDRFAVLDQALSARLSAAQADGRREISAEVGFAWRRLLATGGTIQVAELAEETGWGGRHLRSLASRRRPPPGWSGSTARAGCCNVAQPLAAPWNWPR